MLSRIHLPRITGEVRVAYDVTVSTLPWRSSPPRTSSSAERDAAEPAAVDVGNAVVLREALVHERVVRPQQVEHAAIFAHDALEEQLRFLAERLTQIVVEVRETAACPASSMRGCAGTATARRSCSPARASADPPACAAPAAPASAGVCSFPCDRRVQQFVVRDAAP